MLPKINTKYEGLVFYLWKKNFKPYIGKVQSHFVDDIQSELRTIALEALREDKSFTDKKDVFKFIQKKIYRFLRNYGYRRPKNYSGYMSDIKSLQIAADSILN